MRIALARKYRIWMLALLPTTLGLGTAALWARSLNWPLSVDANGITLRYLRKVPWKSIRKISVWRSYLDGHVSRIDIHRHRRVCKIPIRVLRDGDDVAETILAMFKQSRRSRRMHGESGSPQLQPPKMPATVERLHLVHNDPKRPRASPQRSAALQREAS